jgi:FkbM family methyltransferase
MIYIVFFTVEIITFILLHDYFDYFKNNHLDNGVVCENPKSFKDLLLRYPKYAKQNVTIRRTITDPPFVFAGIATYGGGSNGDIIRNGVWSPTETSIFRVILKERDPRYDGVVIDVGANVGYFTILSASLGFRVLSYEPNPNPFLFVKLNIELNGLGHLIKAHNLGVSNRPSHFYLSDSDDWSIATVVNSPGLLVNTTTLWHEINENVLLLKIDVEGFEDVVLQDFELILKKYNIENILLEIKKIRNVQFKRKFMNMLVKDYNYVLLTHSDGDSLKCTNIKFLNDDDWITWEDTWFIKKNSPTYFKVKDTFVTCAKI